MDHAGHPPSSATSPLDARFDALAAAFVAARRAGNAPSIDDLAREHPDLAERIHSLFPTLLELEKIAPARLLERIGDYRIVRVVAQGGMGVVYEAIQDQVGRRVALKTLPSGVARDPTYLERFRRESRAVGALQHPHIVQLYEAGVEGGEHFFAMEFVDGIGLDALATQSVAWRRGDLTAPHPLVIQAWSGGLGESSTDNARTQSPSERLWQRSVVRIACQIAEALAFSHAHGILHRDVKPSNVVLGRDGRARLTDFGLAKSEDSDDLTVTGDVVGTLRYMAPERFRGSCDARGDIYGLGLVLYELVTHTTAFESLSKSQLLLGRAHLELTRARQVLGDVPIDLDTILAKATASAPEQRYPTADAFAADLRSFLEGGAIAARDPSTWYLLKVAVRRNKLASAIAAGALALLAGGGVQYVLDVRRERDAATNARDLADAQRYAASIASAADAVARGDVVRAQLAMRSIAPEKRGWEYEHLQARVEQSTWVSPRRDTHYDALATSADGSRLFAVLDWTLECWNTATHELEFAVELQEDQCSNIAVHPDGRTLAIAGERKRVVKLFDLVERRVVRDLQGHTDQTKDVVYLDSGRRLVSAGWDGVAIVWDPVSGEAQHSLSHGGQWLHDLDVDRDQRWLAMCGGQALALFDAESFELRSRVQFDGEDARRVVFTANASALIVALHSGEHRMLGLPGLTELARWRDVERLGNALASDPLGEFAVTGADDGRLVLRALDGPRLPFVFGGHAREVSAVCFAPDGQRFFSASWDGCIREWPTPRTDVSTLAGHFSVVCGLDFDASGKRLVSSSEDGTLRVWDMQSRSQIAVHVAPFAPSCLDIDDAGQFAVAALHRIVGVYDLEGDAPPRFLPTASGANAVAVSARGAIAAVGPGGDVEVWSGAGLEVAERASTERPDLAAVVFDPSGERLATSDAKGELCLWRLDPLRLERRIPAHPDAACYALEWATPETLLSGSSDQRLCAWLPTSGALQQELDTGRELTNSAAHSVWGIRHMLAAGRVVSISTGAIARMWDLGSGQPVLSLDLGAGCWALAATRDAEVLAFGLVDGRIRLYERSPRKPDTVERALVARRTLAAEDERVARAFATGASVADVVAQLRTDGSLSPLEREQSLSRARTWLGDPLHLLAWVEGRLRGPVRSVDEHRELENLVLGLARRCRSCGGVSEARWRSLRAVSAARTAQAADNGDFSRVVQLFHDALELATRTGVELPAWHHALFASALVRAGELEPARRELELVASRAQELGEAERALLAAAEADVAAAAGGTDR